MSSHPESPEQLFVAELPLIERVIDSICRRHCCFGPDAEDFSSSVKVKLMDDDYAVLRRFRSQAKLSTFLTTVVANQFRDFRNQKWGKWRPSAAARRQGTVGIQLDKLLTRDGYSLDEAVEVLRTRLGSDAPPRQELFEIAARLPDRPRRRFEGEERLETLPDADRADRRVLDEEREAAMEGAKAALARALRRLPAEDRLIVKMRFGDGFTVALIARQLGIKQRRLYSRIERLLKTLRQGLEAEGVGDEVTEVLGWE